MRGKNYIKKLIALTTISTILLAAIPVGASALWRQNSNNDWQWKEGSTYTKGWKNINDSWYYFDKNGIMAHNTLIDGYYINDKGSAFATTKNDNMPIRIPSNWISLGGEKAGTYVIDGSSAFIYLTADTKGYPENSFIQGMKDKLKVQSANVLVSEKNYNGIKATCMEFDLANTSQMSKVCLIVTFNNNKAYGFGVAGSSENYNNIKQQLEDVLNLTLKL